MGTYFSEIQIGIPTTSFKKNAFENVSKWWPFRLGGGGGGGLKCVCVCVGGGGGGGLK